MADPIRATRARVAADVSIGPDVVIEADEVQIGPGVRIGHSDGDDFRTLPGVRIRVQRLVLGAGAVIGRGVRLEGGDVRLGEGVRVLRHSAIKVLDTLEVGDGGTIGEQCEISGREVRFGQQLWMLPQAKVGGGSAFEHGSRLDAGHYLHLGVQTLINTARPVRIGHEVGLGTRTSIYTHGAYPSRLQGFPVAFDGVEIGDFTWVPGAVINPGVRIGRNCVIGVNSLVTSSIPDGSLAAGSPARVIREGAYPRPLDPEARLAFFEGFLADYARILGSGAAPVRSDDGVVLEVDGVAYVAGGAAPATERIIAVTDAGDASLPAPGATRFDTQTRFITGVADAASERFANELRRYGVRFYSRARDGAYVPWVDEPPSFS